MRHKDFKIKKRAEEVDADSEEEVVGADAASPAGEADSDQEAASREKTSVLLRAALKSASEGISKGISADFASKRDASSIFGDIEELFVAPLLLSTPGRTLERSIKDTSRLTKANDEVNKEAKLRLQDKVIAPSLQLYGSNFAPLISVLDSISYIKNIEPNDTTNIEAMAIEFKGKDLSVTNFSKESPYKIIIKQIIPIIREKFDAITSFDQSLGPGAKIDYDGLSQDLLDGMRIEEDIAELERFYKAIIEWRSVLHAFREGTDNTKSLSSSSSEEDEASSEEEAAESPALAPIEDDIYIHSVRPGQYVHRDPSGTGRELFINSHALSSGDTPVVKLFLKGGGADRVNQAGSGEAYLRHFIEKGKVIFPEEIGSELSRIIYNVTRESVAGGSEITIYFKSDAISTMISGPTSRPEVMTIVTYSGAVSVVVDSASDISELRRAASGETTSYYEAVSPSGETVFFTPTDLVISGGKLKDSKGKGFAPKRIKGKSLAQRVNSKSFGKVRGKK